MMMHCPLCGLFCRRYLAAELNVIKEEKVTSTANIAVT